VTGYGLKDPGSILDIANANNINKTKEVPLYASSVICAEVNARKNKYNVTC
jgi:hypothetical protein